jgi:hypothetical protein
MLRTHEAVDCAPARIEGDPVVFSPEPAKRPFPVWAMVVIPLVGVLALLAWLLTAGILALGLAPSSSPSENMKGLVIGLLPYTLLPASVLTAAALFIAGACAPAPVTKAIMFVLGAAAMIFLTARPAPRTSRTGPCAHVGRLTA